MPPLNPIPSFLLPQRSALWRSPSVTSISVRHSSNKPIKAGSKFNPKAKPLVLQKPERFNPPSHPARIRKPAPQYGPSLSQEQKAQQKTKSYPNMFPPKGTFMYWFLTSKAIHAWFTLSVLFMLASSVTITNFKRDSPFADMLPRWSQFFLHPIAYTRTLLEIIRLHTAHRSQATAEKRKHIAEDVRKRATYRRAHGLDLDEVFGWTLKDENQLKGIKVQSADSEDEGAETKLTPAREKRPVRKWLGIW